MIEPAAFIGFFPIGRAIAPPRIELLRLGVRQTGGIAPMAGGQNILQRLRFHRGVANHIEELFVAPDIVFERGDIEIAHQHGARLLGADIRA